MFIRVYKVVFLVLAALVPSFLQEQLLYETLELPTNVQQCMDKSQKLLNQDHAIYTLYGSTTRKAPYLHADTITNYHMYLVEHQTACFIQVVLEDNLRLLAALLTRSAENTWVHASTQPGMAQHVPAEALRKYGAVAVENVILDMSKLQASMEVAISGLEIELPVVLPDAPRSLTIPALRLRVTIAFQLKPKGGQMVGVQVDDVAARLSILEPPHIAEYRDSVVAPVFDIADYILEQQFNMTLLRFEKRFMNTLARVLKTTFNLALSNVDIGVLQPYTILQIVELAKTSEQIQRGTWGI